MIDEILNIIEKTFQKEYFLGYGHSEITENKLNHQIEDFNNRFPYAVAEFIEKLKINFPNAKIENLTQFFNLDRCIRFLVQLSEEQRFICQLSIYGYFSVYESPCWFKDGKYTYGEKKFINQKENIVCDLLYECSKVLKQPPIWIDRLTLSTIVFDFSLSKAKYSHQIKIADILFTAHFI